MALARLLLIANVVVTVTLASATPFKQPSPVAKHGLVKKHAHGQAPQGWEKLDISLEDHHKISLHIGLKQTNVDGLVNELYDVSDPAGLRYGKHLSQA